MQNQEDQEIEIDLREIIGLLFNRLWILILSGIIVAAAAGGITKVRYVPAYTSTSQMYILGNVTGSSGISSALADLSSTLQIGSQLTQDYMVLIQSRPVLEQVIENLDLDMGYDQLLGMIGTDNPSNTRILEVSITSGDPELSKEIVNELVEVGKKRIAEVMQAQEPNIVTEGVDGYLSTSSNVVKNTAVGFVIGAFIAAFIVVVLYLMDDTIKSSEDLEKYLGLNTLGTIPLAEETSSKSKKKGRKKSGKKTK